MDRKTSSGQILIEFMVLIICLGCLYSIIHYKHIDLNKTKASRWDKK